MMLKGRQGIVCDETSAYDAVEPVAALGCSDCQGVLACCFLLNMRQRSRAQASLAMARRSATSGSSYGQYAVGCARVRRFRIRHKPRRSRFFLSPGR
jgi:hypothetical protein